jgi:hypothetical protein
MSQDIENSKASTTPPKKKKLTMVEQFNKRVEMAQKVIIKDISTEEFVDGAIQVVKDRAKDFLLDQLGVDRSWSGLSIKRGSHLEKALKNRIPEALTVLLDALDFDAIIQEVIEDEAFRKKILKLIRTQIKDYLKDDLRNIVHTALEERIGSVVKNVMGEESVAGMGGLIYDIEESLKCPRW